MADLDGFLATHGIVCDRVDHPPVFTIDEVERLVPPLDGAATKNLFLRDKKGTRQALVVVGADKPVDLRALAASTGFERPSFGSADRLKRCLGIEPGSVSLLALVNDPARAVEVFIDRDLWAADAMHCHPLVNTATLSVRHDDVERFLSATGHAHRLVDVPAAPLSGPA
ncbi:MAG: prolyl-tRNA synthetase associated domain-containing protein [Gemmatimonadaceae bacterium]|nr:prolyl-tRNA synthetase associated domain-containing protein [Gemmatimonadaceae bacterium]